MAQTELTCDCAPCGFGGTWAPQERLRRRDKVVAEYRLRIGCEPRYSLDKFKVVERLNDRGHLLRVEFMYGDETPIKQCWCQEAEAQKPGFHPTCPTCEYTQLYYLYRGTERFWLPPLDWNSEPR
ncbi:hypothetical protein pclt_cds_693 [Pandoravirus celtis]|uniref:Uncharacterized protein n=1 Tax=Pandoravirus celtis TaxID=2568002 RepID=A0A4D6EHI9_9VIRU|nr:hypothetical protein pclt_cds_693 [Pandoravirus celtis]